MAETYTGSWGPETISGTEVTYDTFVALVDGEHTITHTVPGASQYRASITTKNGTTNGAYVDPSTVTVTETLTAGDVVRFVARRSFSSSQASGSWTIIAPISAISVTPQAPTFNTDYTVTLPTQAGVDYSMSGTPGPGESVTVTATAQEGYVLVGTSVWSHFFPIPPLPDNAVSPSQIDGVYIGNTQVLAMYHGAELLWHRITTVIVAAPTFFEDDPWYTVPTQNGVTYTVSGTPGAGNTATITATPVSQYYILSGQTVWSKTWAASGSWGPVVVNGTTPRLMDSFTVTAGGQYTISHTVGWGAMIRTPAGTVDGVGSFPSVATVTVILAAGDVVEFMVRPDGFAQESGSWSVIKN